MDLAPCVHFTSNCKHIQQITKRRNKSLPKKPKEDNSYFTSRLFLHLTGISRHCDTSLITLVVVIIDDYQAVARYKARMSVALSTFYIIDPYYVHNGRR